MLNEAHRFMVFEKSVL